MGPGGLNLLAPRESHRKLASHRACPCVTMGGFAIVWGVVWAKGWNWWVGFPDYSLPSRSGIDVRCHCSECHGIRLFTESQHGWGWQGPMWVTQPKPPPKQGHPEQAAQHRVQAGLEYLQRRRLHSLPGQPGPGLRHPQREEVLPHVQTGAGSGGDVGIREESGAAGRHLRQGGSGAEQGLGAAEMRGAVGGQCALRGPQCGPVCYQGPTLHDLVHPSAPSGASTHPLQTAQFSPQCPPIPPFGVLSPWDPLPSPQDRSPSPQGCGRARPSAFGAAQGPHPSAFGAPQGPLSFSETRAPPFTCWSHQEPPGFLQCAPTLFPPLCAAEPPSSPRCSAHPSAALWSPPVRLGAVGSSQDLHKGRTELLLTQQRAVWWEERLPRKEEEHSVLAAVRSTLPSTDLPVANKSLFLHKKCFNSALAVLKWLLAKLKSIYIFSFSPNFFPFWLLENIAVILTEFFS